VTNTGRLGGARRRSTRSRLKIIDEVKGNMVCVLWYAERVSDGKKKAHYQCNTLIQLAFTHIYTQ
jgi:hypothetical protein